MGAGCLGFDCVARRATMRLGAGSWFGATRFATPAVGPHGWCGETIPQRPPPTHIVCPLVTPRDATATVLHPPCDATHIVHPNQVPDTVGDFTATIRAVDSRRGRVRTASRSISARWGVNSISPAHLHVSPMGVGASYVQTSWRNRENNHLQTFILPLLSAVARRGGVWSSWWSRRGGSRSSRTTTTSQPTGKQEYRSINIGSG